MREFVDESSQLLNYQEIPFANGLFWFSEQYFHRKTVTTPVIPKGLHMGCGIVSGSSILSTGHSFSFERAGMTMFNSVHDSIECTTSVNNGKSTVCGFYLSEEAFETSEDSRELNALLPADKDHFSAQETSITDFSRLLTPLSNNLYGHAKRLMLESRALEFFAVLSGLATNQTSNPYHEQSDKRLYQLTGEYIDANYEAHITLSEIAASVGCSVRRMTDVFRRYSGNSIIEYLTELRMLKARALLEQGAQVKQVAYEVGYKPASFSTAFSRRFGISPSAYAISFH